MSQRRLFVHSSTHFIEQEHWETGLYKSLFTPQIPKGAILDAAVRNQLNSKGGARLFATTELHSIRLA